MAGCPPALPPLLAHCLACWGAPLDGALAAALLRLSQPQLRCYSGQQLATMLEAFAQLRLAPSESWWGEAATAVLSQLTDASATAASIDRLSLARHALALLACGVAPVQDEGGAEALAAEHGGSGSYAARRALAGTCLLQVAAQAPTMAEGQYAALLADTASLCALLGASVDDLEAEGSGAVAASSCTAASDASADAAVATAAAGGVRDALLRGGKALAPVWAPRQAVHALSALLQLGAIGPAAPGAPPSWVAACLRRIAGCDARYWAGGLVVDAYCVLLATGTLQHADDHAASAAACSGVDASETQLQSEAAARAEMAARWQALALRAASSDTLQPGQVASLLTALAASQQRPPAAWLRAVLAGVHTGAAMYSADDLARVLWAAAHMDFRPPDALLQRCLLSVTHAALPAVAAGEPAASIAHGTADSAGAAAGGTPSEAAMHAAASQLLSPGGLARALWAFGSLDYQLPDHWTAAALAALQPRLPRMSAAEVADAIGGALRLRHTPQQAFLTAALQRAVELLGGMVDETYRRLAGALASHGVRGSGTALQRFCAHPAAQRALPPQPYADASHQTPSCAATAAQGAAALPQDADLSRSLQQLRELQLHDEASAAFDAASDAVSSAVVGAVAAAQPETAAPLSPAAAIYMRALDMQLQAAVLSAVVAIEAASELLDVPNDVPSQQAETHEPPAPVLTPADAEALQRQLSLQLAQSVAGLFGPQAGKPADTRAAEELSWHAPAAHAGNEAQAVAAPSAAVGSSLPSVLQSALALKLLHSLHIDGGGDGGRELQPVAVPAMVRNAGGPGEQVVALTSYHQRSRLLRRTRFPAPRSVG